jgi:Cu/Ag efflux pump CusA
VTVFGGMIVSTFLNLFIIPVLYTVVRGWLPMKTKVTLREAPELVEKIS